MIRVDFLASFIFFCVTGVACSRDEVFALLEFKHAIGDDPNGSMNNWNESASNPCLWNGISCQEERVVSVSIPRKNLAGVISPAIGSLLYLRHLNLRNNKFHGSLPVELFRLLGLQSLVVNVNLLGGSIPQEIGNLSYLQTLDFSQNYLEGHVPSSVTRCRRLRILNLSKNNLSGSLPESFGSDLSSLSKLNISFNTFDGPLPMDMGNLSNLEGTVDLSHNAFSGLVPSSLGELPEKVYIDLTYNNLSGPIPQNGGLTNRGPTAFLGNPHLCGPPLKNPCVTSSVPGLESPTSFPFVTAEDQRGRGQNRSVLIAVVVGDVVGICLLSALFLCCYSRLCRSGLDSARKKGDTKDCLCLCRNKDDTDSHSDNGEPQYDLVALDSKVKFNLEELLRASAFVLGKSGVGIMYRVVLEDGTTLAVRRLGEGGSQRFKEFRNEVEAIGKLKHPNVVALKAYYWSIDEKLLIYEYVPRGNLSIAIHAPAPAAAIPWSVRTRIMRGIARGLACLHEISPRKYVHGDLNPNNVLLDDRMEARISDFGLGRLATIAGGWSDTATQSIRGTPQRGVVDLASCYQAPEAAEAVKPSQKWDVYSYGVVLLEVVTGRWPVLQVGDESIGIVRWIRLCIDEKQKLEDVLDPNLVEDFVKEEEMVAVLKIALSCVDGIPDLRPTMRDVSEAMNRLFS